MVYKIKWVCKKEIDLPSNKSVVNLYDSIRTKNTYFPGDQN